MATPPLNESFLDDLDDLGDIDVEEEAGNEEVKTLNFDFDSICKLQNSRRYIDILQKVEDAKSFSEDDPAAEYEFVLECNSVSLDIDDEIAMIHNFVHDNYRSKFPELEPLINHPIDYCRVVKRIGNEIDLSAVDLGDLLPPAIIMAVSVAASTSSGKPLKEDVLRTTIEACNRALDLDSCKTKIDGFVESRMGYIALVGSAVAAVLLHIFRHRKIE